MTRDQFSQKIGWPKIIWILGLINVGTMLPQLVKIIKTQQTEGLALEFFALACFMQSAYGLQGFFTRDKMLMWTMALSALVTAAIIVSISYIRWWT